MLRELTNGRKLYLLALIVALAGTPLLMFLSSMDNNDTIPLASVPEHTGETIRVRGTLVGVGMNGSGPVDAYLYDGTAILKVRSEYWPAPAPPCGSILSVKGGILGTRSSPVLYCSEPASVRVVGSSEPSPVELGELSGSPPGLYRSRAMVFECREWWGRGTLWLRNDDPKISMEWPLEVDCPMGCGGLAAGDLVLLDLLIGPEEISCYHTDARDAFLGHCEPAVRELPALFEMEAAGELGNDTYLALSGYLRYEPSHGGSGTISLCEKLVTPCYALTVSVPALDGLHKGDDIVVNGRLTPRGGRLERMLDADTVEVIESHGPWRCSVTELLEDAIYMDQAIVSVPGTYIGGEAPLIRDGNTSLLIVNTGPQEEGATIRVTGVFGALPRPDGTLGYGINVTYCH